MKKIKLITDDSNYITAKCLDSRYIVMSWITSDRKNICYTLTFEDGVYVFKSLTGAVLGHALPTIEETIKSLPKTARIQVYKK